jgi:hypothetical protein
VEANVLDVYASRSDVTGESDLVVVFDGEDSRFALLIEDKIDAPRRQSSRKATDFGLPPRFAMVTIPITSCSFARQRHMPPPQIQSYST